MKTLFRNILLYIFILYFLPNIIPGLHITGGPTTVFIGGLSLAFMFLVIRPILNIISFPVNLITLGLFSGLINMFILYLLTIFITSITIVPFTYNRMDIGGFIIPQIYFNTFFAYAYAAFLLSALESFFKWLIE